MAIVVVFDGTRLSAAQSASDNGVWDKFDASQDPVQDDNVKWNGTVSQSNKVLSGEDGIEFVDDATVDLITPPQVVSFKVLIVTQSILELRGPGGAICLIGSGTTTDRYRYNVFGKDNYPDEGGWQFVSIDPSLAAYYDTTEGTPDLDTGGGGGAQYYAFAATFSAAARSENIASAALDYMAYGEGLTITGGDSGTPATLDDFLDEDQGIDDNKWAVIIRFKGTLNSISGFLNIGTATAVYFKDANRSLVSPDGLVDEGFYGCKPDLQNASSVFDVENYTWESLGKDNKKVWFDTELEVIDQVDTGATKVYVVDVSGPTYDDITTAFNDTTDADWSPVPATEATDDYIAIGLNDTFTQLTFDNANGTQGGNGAGDWQYFSETDSTWVDLSGLTDNTNDFKASVADGQTVSWTLPTDWARTSLDGEPPLYYIRFVVTSTYNTNPVYDQGFAQNPDYILAVGHTFETGQAVLYSKQGGSEAIGLTDATQYFVGRRDDDEISIHTTKDGADHGSSRVALTPSTTNNGEQHSFRRQPDTRSTFAGSGTSGTGTMTGWQLTRWREITMTSAFTFLNGIFNQCSSITLGGGALDTCTGTQPFLTEGESFVTTADLDDLSGCTFTAGDDGHAIEKTTATSDGWDHSHSGYWSPADTGWNFDTITGIASNIITTDAAHGFSDGDAAYYNDEGGTDTIGLTDGDRYYIGWLSTTTFTVHLTKAAAIAASNAITLSDGSTGETHSLYSSKAVVYNSTSSGTLTIGVTGGNAPSYRNASGATTVVNVSVPVTFEAVDKIDVAIEACLVSAYLISDDSEVILQDTNASGIASTTFSGSTPADIYYKYKKSSTGAQKYVNLSGFGTIESSTGVTIKRSMREDDIADPSI